MGEQKSLTHTLADAVILSFSFDLVIVSFRFYVRLCSFTHIIKRVVDTGAMVTLFAKGDLTGQE